MRVIWFSFASKATFKRSTCAKTAQNLSIFFSKKHTLILFFEGSYMFITKLRMEFWNICRNFKNFLKSWKGLSTRGENFGCKLLIGKHICLTFSNLRSRFEKRKNNLQRIFKELCVSEFYCVLINFDTLNCWTLNQLARESSDSVRASCV